MKRLNDYDRNDADYACNILEKFMCSVAIVMVIMILVVHFLRYLGFPI